MCVSEFQHCARPWWLWRPRGSKSLQQQWHQDDRKHGTDKWRAFWERCGNESREQQQPTACEGPTTVSSVQILKYNHSPSLSALTWIKNMLSLHKSKSSIFFFTNSDGQLHQVSHTWWTVLILYMKEGFCVSKYSFYYRGEYWMCTCVLQWTGWGSLCIFDLF